MRIWKIEGADLERFLRKFQGDAVLRYVRIGTDGDTIKVKANEYEWSAPIGFLEVEQPKPLDPVAEDVLAECRAEAVRSMEQAEGGGDPDGAWSPADVAADIVRRLDTYYEIGYAKERLEVPARLHDMVATYFAGAYRDTEAVQNLAEVMNLLGDLLDGQRPAAPIVTPAEHLYEKCDGCHFFIEANDPRDVEAGAAPYVHNTRGTELDDLMACDEARPSGRKANLLTWKTYGPVAMRERFTS